MSCCKTYNPCIDGNLNQIGSYAAAARTSAESSATSASQSAGSASSAATSAANAAASAALCGIYLGAFAVAPTVDNQGNPLQEGMLYFNTTSNGLFVWNGTVWTSADFNEFTNFTAAGTITARNLVTRTADEVNVLDFGAFNDGTNAAANTTAIQAAINYCNTNSKSLFWPDGNYAVNTSLANFWNIQHIGYGKILRGSNTWYITPTGTQTNILYVTSSGNSANDGFDSANSLPTSEAITRLRNIGSKASGGIWRIQIQGTIAWNGVRVQDWPAFANAVEIWGEAASLTSVPTTVWDGTTSTEAYAFRAENANSVINLHFKNIKFINFNSGTNSGGIVVFASGLVLAENIHTDNCAIGIWCRQNQARILYGHFKNAITYGVAIQYCGIGNVGNLSGAGVKFENCDTGVSIGRATASYIQGCEFIGNFDVCIDVSRNSRIRTQANNFTSVNTSYINFTRFVSTTILGAWTPDNFTGFPDTYPTLTQGTPVLLQSGGSVHLHLQRGADRSVHIVSDGIVTIENQNGNQILLSSYGSGNSTWIPFRIPSFYLYNREAVLDIDITLALVAGAGGELALHGSGSGNISKLASITIAPVASYTRGLIQMRAYNSTESVNTWRSIVSFPEIGFYEEKPTVDYNITAMRDNNENLLLFRLYWTPSSNAEVTFINTRSYVEA